MQNEKLAFDIIIQAGQSNAEGCGIGPVTEEYVPNDKIYCLTGKVSDQILSETERIITYPDKTLTLDIGQERGTDEQKIGELAFTFADAYVKSGLLAEGRKVLILRTALGGTGFKREQWGFGCPVEERMHEIIAYALEMNPENRIVAFLWHQGESDAVEGNTSENYEKQLTAFVENVREKYDCKDIPFIAGDFCNEWKTKNIEICEPIVNVLRKVFSGEKAAFVETSDLLSNNQKTGNGDDIHFCRESLHIMGKRYFESFLALTNR